MKPRSLTPSMTLTEKILLAHSLGWDKDWVQAGDTLSIAVDWTMASEIAWSGMNKTYEALGRPPLHDKNRFFLALDHTVDKRTLASDVRTQRLVQLSRGFAREKNLRYFYDANTTIMHTELYRQLVRPGDVVLGADSHTTSHGGMGAFAIGLGGSDVVAAMVQGYSWIQVPESVRVHYAGRLPFGLTGKDVVLATLGQMGRNTAALERSVEYTSDSLEELSTDFRFTVANMTAELGGLAGIFPPDVRTRETMARRREPVFRRGGTWLQADEGARYADEHRIDLGALVPKVAKPFSPDNVFNVDEAAGQALDGCFIGACTTSEEELVLGGLVLEAAMEAGRRPVASDNRLVVPGSLEIVTHLREAGLLDVYRRAGFEVGEPGCSMCIGIASDRAQPGETWLSSQNRNFPNRMGQGSITWLSSALTVAASAFDLRISDPRPYSEGLDRDRVARLVSGVSSPLPAVIYDEPRRRAGSATADAGGESAPAAAATIRGQVQKFGDHVDTDAMIAGEFCHLTDLGELGANAFLYTRPDFGDRVRAGEDILVAGEGWGCGSSREMAVWALKGAEVRAIIAKSIAFIHKRNLVNEGVFFLILRDEEFHRAVRDGDAVEIDPATGRVRLGDQVFQGQVPEGVMASTIADGGLVPCLKKKWEPAEYFKRERAA